MRKRLACFVSVAFVAIGSQGWAQDWPTKPVTIVSTFAAGGSLDSAARFIANALTDKLHQPVLVENRAGGGGAVGSLYVARAPADGYTLLFTAIGPAVLNHLLYKSVAYDTDRDFEPIILVGDVPNVLLGASKHDFKSLQDFVTHVRAKGDAASIGHPGPGSMGHLASALLLSRIGARAALVAYRGAPQIITDLLNGTLDSGFPVYIPAAASVKALAVATEHRVPFLPDIPTAREQGVDVVATTWFAIMAPAGLPSGVAERLNGSIDEFLQSPTGQQQFARIFIKPTGGSPALLAKMIAADRVMWKPIIDAAHISLDAN